ncbi:MAG: biopolymer transporter ExbD [Bacteroidota bacterium]
MRILGLVLVHLFAVASAQEGIYMQLPTEDLQPVAGPTLAIEVHATGAASVNGVTADSTAISTAIREHIRTHPDGVVAFDTERGVSYRRYLEALDTIKDAFTAERDKVARTEFGLPYSGLKEPERSVVHDRVPLRISLAEPD